MSQRLQLLMYTDDMTIYLTYRVRAPAEMSGPGEGTVGDSRSSVLSAWTLRDASRSHMSVVPPEVRDYIIDVLHDDKSALRQCSLVCRGWIPSSSYHLFKILWWPPCYHAWCGRNWSREQCRCATLDGSNFWSELVRFIEGKPRVRGRIRTLAVVFHWTLFDPPGPGEDDEGILEHRAKVALGEFANGFDKLPQLRSLYLRAP